METEGRQVSFPESGRVVPPVLPVNQAVLRPPHTVLRRSRPLTDPLTVHVDALWPGS